jgi:hypothetical protein
MPQTSREPRERNLLALVPERTKDYVLRDDGLVDVIIPRFGDGRVAKVLETLIKRTPILLKLDEIGTLTWHLCDGKHTVEEIGDQMDRTFGQRVEPVYDRLALFFKEMERRELIRWKESGAPGTTREK